MEPFDEVIYNTKLDEINVTIGELLSVDQAQMTIEFAVQAARFAYLAAEAAKAEALYNEAKTKREQVYADVELDYREDYKDQKTTEAYIRSMVISDEVYIRYQGYENDALKKFKVLKALSDAMKQRGEMLISLGASLRQEYEMQNISILAAKDKLVKIRDGK